MNAAKSSFSRIANRLLSRFREQRIVAEEPILGGRIVSGLARRQEVNKTKNKMPPTSARRIQIPQIGVL